jgi:hypothetical protein
MKTFINGSKLFRIILVLFTIRRDIYIELASGENVFEKWLLKSKTRDLLSHGSRFIISLMRTFSI